MQKIRNNKHIKHYIAYSISIIIYGIILICLGPIIPYLAAETGKKQTQFSFLLAAKAYGMLFGALALNFIQQKQYCPSCHQFMLMSSIGISISSILFCCSSAEIFQGLFMFLGAIFYLVLQVQINVCVLNLSQKSRQSQFWLQIIWGIFSVGGVLGPLVVYNFGKNTYIVIGILTGISAPMYYYLQSPEIIKQQEQNQMTDLNGQEIKKKTQMKSINNKILYLHCFIIFLYIGCIINAGTWVSSYAVIADICTKQQAVVFPSILFFVMTFARFGASIIPMTGSLKMKYATIGIVATNFLTLVLIKLQIAQFSLYFQSILLGIFIAPINAIIYSMASEYRFHLKNHETSSIATWGVIGQGVIAPVTGILMEYISIDILFVSMILMGILMYIGRHQIISQFLKLNRQSDQLKIQLLQLSNKTQRK